MYKICPDVTFGGSVFSLGYEVADPNESGLEGQDGYVVILAKDGIQLASKRVTKGATAGLSAAEYIRRYFVVQANQALTAVITPPAPAPTDPTLSDWKKECLAFFPKLSLQVVSGKLTVVMAA